MQAVGVRFWNYHPPLESPCVNPLGHQHLIYDANKIRLELHKDRCWWPKKIIQLYPPYYILSRSLFRQRLSRNGWKSKSKSFCSTIFFFLFPVSIRTSKYLRNKFSDCEMEASNLLDVSLGHRSNNLRWRISTVLSIYAHNTVQKNNYVDDLLIGKCYQQIVYHRLARVSREEF